MNQAERWAFIKVEARKVDLAYALDNLRRQASPELVREIELEVARTFSEVPVLENTRALLLGILGDRGFGPSEETRARVEGEVDVWALNRWVRRAATAPTEAAVFASV
jgi:hypothetical protein